MAWKATDEVLGAPPEALVRDDRGLFALPTSVFVLEELDESGLPACHD